MAKDPHLNEEDREHLSAFLDGELDPQSSQILEARLSRDPRVRREADALRKTWDLLDYLPQAQPSATFTSRTMDRITALQPLVQPVKVSLRSFLIGTGWLFALILASTLGYSGVNLYRTASSSKEFNSVEVSEENLRENLRLIENLHLYEHVKDFDFLLKVNELELFGNPEVRAVPAAPTLDPQVRNRSAIDRYKADASLYESLVKEYEHFRSLSPERQQNMQELDRRIFERGPDAADKLLSVLKNYAGWLHILPEAEQTKIDSFPDTESKLKEIKRIRQREWMATLPEATIAAFNRQHPEKQGRFLDDIRKAERARTETWDRAVKAWKPRKVTIDVPPALLRDKEKIVKWAAEFLVPALTPKEKTLLRKAELESAEEYFSVMVWLLPPKPVELPGYWSGPKRFDELPQAVQRQLQAIRAYTTDAAQVQVLKSAEGNWPEYAEEVTRFVRKHDVEIVQQLGPCTLLEFPKSIQQAMEAAIKKPKVFGANEFKRIRDAEKKWPDFPQCFAQLARDHLRDLNFDSMKLPGKPRDWAELRQEVSAVAQSSGAAR